METTNEQIKRLEADNQALKNELDDTLNLVNDLANEGKRAEYYKERYEKAFEKLQSLSAENEDLRKKNEDFQTILHEFAERVREKCKPQEKKSNNPLCEYIMAVKEKQENNEEAHWTQHYDSQSGITFECSNCGYVSLDDEKVCPQCFKTMGKTVVHKSCWY